MHVERAMKELILHKEIIFFCFRPADRTGEDLDIIYARLKVTCLKSEISGVTTCPSSMIGPLIGICVLHSY